MRSTISDFPARGSELTSRQIIGLARVAEQAGFDRFAVSDFPFYRDCVALMTGCLEATTQLAVESLVTTPFRRSPDVTACTWATMADLSEGRAILGIGKGGSPALWMARSGYEPPDPRLAVTELIEVCRAMWHGKPAPESNVLYNSGLTLNFPLDVSVPVLVAARGAKMLAVAGRHADIAHIGSPFLVPSYVQRLVGYVNDAARRAKRSEKGYEVDVTVPISIMKDRKRARELGKITAAAAILWIGKTGASRRPPEFRVPEGIVDQLSSQWNMWTGEPLPDGLAELLTDDTLDQFTIAGTPEECLDRLRTLVSAVQGVTGVRFKLPALVGPASFATLREMIEHLEPLTAELRGVEPRGMPWNR